MQKILEKLKARCEEEGDCWVWQGCVNNGVPVASINGVNSTVRRALYKLAHGEIGSGLVMITTCNDPRCINPDHARVVTRAILAQEMGAAGIMGGTVRSAKISKTKRLKYSKISVDIAQEIRVSNETGVALSKRYGVGQSLVSSVRLHKAWKEYSTPFSGLGARA